MADIRRRKTDNDNNADSGDENQDLLGDDRRQPHELSTAESSDHVSFSCCCSICVEKISSHPSIETVRYAYRSAVP